VVNNVTVNKVSYNGGAGGVAAMPTPQERAAAQERHVPPTALQRQHIQEAVRNPALSARANGGHPSIAATPRPGAFSGPGIVGARGAAMPPRGAPGAGQPNGAHAPANGAGHPPAPKAGAPKPPPHPKGQPERKREPEKNG
jgi:hypothetical protein